MRAQLRRFEFPSQLCRSAPSDPLVQFSPAFLSFSRALSSCAAPPASCRSPLALQVPQLLVHLARRPQILARLLRAPPACLSAQCLESRARRALHCVVAVRPDRLRCRARPVVHPCELLLPRRRPVALGPRHERHAHPAQRSLSRHLLELSPYVERLEAHALGGASHRLLGAGSRSARATIARSIGSSGSISVARHASLRRFAPHASLRRCSPSWRPAHASRPTAANIAGSLLGRALTSSVTPAARSRAQRSS